MRPESYIASSGINNSALKRFRQHGKNVFPTIDPSYEMQCGHAFEAYLRGDFSDDFFVADIDSAWPSSLDAKAVLAGKLPAKRMCKPDKGGNQKPNKKYANFHRWRSACEENAGRFPISQCDYSKILDCSESLLKVRISNTFCIGDVIEFAEWSKEVYWDDVLGRPKKALFDMSFFSEGILYICDVKFYASFANFRSWLRDGGWIQQIHYTEAGMAEYGLDEEQVRFVFLVASKADRLTHLLEIERPYSHMWDAYRELVDEYADWKKAGSPIDGWGQESVRIWT